jgi:antirestriction protein
MYQDFENLPRSVYSESSLAEAWNYWTAVKDLDADTLEAFTDWAENGSGTFEDFSEFEDAYNGKWDSKTDFAEHIISECYDLSKMGELARYFDYEAFARDLFLGDYWMSDNGHIFRS